MNIDSQMPVETSTNMYVYIEPAIAGSSQYISIRLLVTFPFNNYIVAQILHNGPIREKLKLKTVYLLISFQLYNRYERGFLDVVNNLIA